MRHFILYFSYRSQPHLDEHECAHHGETEREQRRRAVPLKRAFRRARRFRDAAAVVVVTHVAVGVGVGGRGAARAALELVDEQRHELSHRAPVVPSEWFRGERHKKTMRRVAVTTRINRKYMLSQVAML